VLIWNLCCTSYLIDVLLWPLFQSRVAPSHIVSPLPLLSLTKIDVIKFAIIIGAFGFPVVLGCMLGGIDDSKSAQMPQAEESVIIASIP
jgi:hypothetical protein